MIGLGLVGVRTLTGCQLIPVIKNYKKKTNLHKKMKKNHWHVGKEAAGLCVQAMPRERENKSMLERISGAGFIQCCLYN